MQHELIAVASPLVTNLSCVPGAASSVALEVKIELYADLATRIIRGQGAEWIRGQDGLKDLPVIILSSSDDPRDRKRTHELGATAYFVKSPQLRDVFVIDLEGHPIVSGTIYPMNYNLDLSDREFFRSLKNNDHADSYLSGVIKSRAAACVRGPAQEIGVKRVHEAGVAVAGARLKIFGRAGENGADLLRAMAGGDE